MQFSHRSQLMFVTFLAGVKMHSSSLCRDCEAAQRPPRKQEKRRQQTVRDCKGAVLGRLAKEFPLPAVAHGVRRGKAGLFSAWDQFSAQQLYALLDFFAFLHARALKLRGTASGSAEGTRCSNTRRMSGPALPECTKYMSQT